MVTRRAAMVGLGLVATVGLPASPRAEPGSGTSDWCVIDHGRVRLIDAGAAPNDAKSRLVGIEVQLDAGYLTYWRSPGEAGVPPSVSFGGSKGLKSATLLFPVPGRYSEDGVAAIGYKDAVTFPVLVRPEDDKTPVALRMVLDFGICERQCLPAKAEAALTLSGDGQGPEAATVRAALDRVPASARVGDAGPLAVTAVRGQAGDDEITVLVRARGADVPLMFAEAPDPWFVQAGEGLWLNDATLRYGLKVLARPVDPAPLPLRLTLATDEGAIEVPVTLDAPPAKP